MVLPTGFIATIVGVYFGFNPTRLAKWAINSSQTKSGAKSLLRRRSQKTAGHANAGTKTLVPVSRHLATARLWIFPCSRNLGFLQKTSFVLQKTGYSLDILFLLRISSSNTCSNV